MLNDAKLSAKWWAEAWAYLEIVENLLPSSRHPGTIPEEKFTGQRQDVGHIRVWGCIAFVFIPSEKDGGKLGDRGQKGRLVGMEGRGVYRVLIPETGQIIKSRNIVFEEGLGHRTLTTEGEYFADDATQTMNSLKLLRRQPRHQPRPSKLSKSRNQNYLDLKLSIHLLPVNQHVFRLLLKLLTTRRSTLTTTKMKIKQL
jgi:hypothetical protein